MDKTSPPSSSTKTLGLTRRRFLGNVVTGALGTVGGVLCVGGILELSPCVVQAKAVPQPAVGHIARVSDNISACASCGQCTMVCAAVHGHDISPSLAGIWLDRKPFECAYHTVACRQCADPKCVYACDTGALHINEKTGARAIDSDKCVGCKQCIDACVYETPRITWDEEHDVAVKCDLCSERPEGPACVEFCPMQALVLVKGTNV